MTWPEDSNRPADAPQPGPLTPPPRLWLLTFPLMVGLIYNSISLLTLPFSSGTLGEMMARMEEAAGVPLTTLSPEQIQTVLWLSFFLTAALILWLYFTRRAVLEGRRWGRVSSLVIGVLSLLLFPIGTVFGVMMLIGAFDRDVTAYLSR